MKRLDVSAEEIEPLINAIRSDGWRSYQTVSKKLGIVHNRAFLPDPKDSMKLLPWTHKIMQMLKQFLLTHIEVYQEDISKAIFQKYVIVLIGGFGE